MIYKFKYITGRLRSIREWYVKMYEEVKRERQEEEEYLEQFMWSYPKH